MPTTPRIALALLAVVAASSLGAQADSRTPGTRTFTADDLFSIEQIGDVAPSPNGAWVAYVHKRQPRTASGFKRDFMQGGDYADIWVAPTSGGPPRNITNGARDGVGYFAPVWSPDSRRLALFSTKGGDVHLWLWDQANGRLRSLITDRAAATISGANIVWIDSAHLATVVLPAGESPLSLTVERLPALTLMRAWPKAWEGREATASVLDAGAGEQPVSHPKRELLMVDVDRGTARVIVPGDVGAFAVSPDHRRIAVLRRTATYQPTAGARVSSGLNRDRYELAVSAADGSELWNKVDGLGAFRGGLGAPQPLWSDDGNQLAVFARPPSGASLDDRLFRLTVDTRRVEDVTPPNVDLASATAMWTSSGSPRLLVFAKQPGGDPKQPRSDWWLVEGAGQARNLTAAMKSAPARLVRADDNSLIGVAEGSIWRLTVDGSSPANLAPNATTKYTSIVWPTDPTVKTSVAIVASAHDNVEGLYRLDILSTRIGRFETPSPDSRIVGALPPPDRGGFYVLTEANGGTTLSLVRSPEKANVPVASLNAFLGSIVPGELKKFEYRTTDGQNVKGWLILPPGYTPERKYPMVLWVYAGSVMSDKPPSLASLNRFSAFNMQIAAAHGYVVMFPSMPLKPTPEESNWEASDPYLDLAKGVLPAIDKVIDMGIADPKKIGVMGQSYGGYSTMALITQTDRFAAAVELAGPPDLLSLYGQFETREALTDDRMESPGRDVYYLDWSEAGQGRMGNPPWKDLQRYLRNSPIIYADRITTPLMLVQGDMDIIGMQQGQEMFTALYRQNKRARFVRYWGEGHVLNSPANIKDFWTRAFAWFDQYFGLGKANATN